VSNRLSILIYHRVLPERDPLQPDIPDATQFARHMGALKRWYRVLPLADAVRRLFDGTLPSRAAAVTFDDGYRDNVEVALPILQRLNVHATFFIATGFLGGGRMWNDTVIESVRAWRDEALDIPELDMAGISVNGPGERQAAIARVLQALKYLPGDERLSVANAFAERVEIGGRPLMMDEEQVRALVAAGMDIGGHTVTHPILQRLQPNEAHREIVEGRRTLQEITGNAVPLFAYPNGKPATDYCQEHVRMVRDAGFEAAVSTAWAAASVMDDIYQLPRFTPWDQKTVRYLVRLAASRLRGGKADRVGGDAAVSAERQGAPDRLP